MKDDIKPIDVVIFAVCCVIGLAVVIEATWRLWA